MKAEEKQIQRYISKELTHFVGRGKRTESQYRLLIKILREGLLYNTKANVSLVVNLSAKISQNEMYLPQMVCFCDIPVEDLTLHIKKYSKFGISFSKDFVVKQGGAPVHYIPAQSHVKTLLNITPEQSVEFVRPEGGEHLYKDINKAEYFDEVVKRYHKLFQVLHKCIYEAAQHRTMQGANNSVNSFWDSPKDTEGYPVLGFPHNALSKLKLPINNNPGRDAMWYDEQLSQFQTFLYFHIFSFLKFFNHNLSDEHEENFYFEREWRVMGSIQFKVEDVRRILIPERYSRQFRDDCPNYYGQVTFVE
ncbi:MAG: abortive infection system antitoxin AbiGi family protein [Nitrospira sp.]|nr:abortive infection system antitoxin AbiGi family protein [Nitrospira sp.]